MDLHIADDIFNKYPEVEIGYLVADVTVLRSDPDVDLLKKQLAEFLREKGINETNFVAHPSISLWRHIYERDFHVKPKSYRSSIEALLKRVLTGKGIWNISNVVDVYNCCSVLTLLPMGGYDLQKVTGDIEIRFGVEGEKFKDLRQKETSDVSMNHVVYADNQRIMCWLWNYKDCLETCIDENTKKAIFFIDGLSTQPNQMQLALDQLARNLEKINCHAIKSGLINKASRTAHIVF